MAEVGAEQASSSSAAAGPRLRWVTVRLRATTFFRLDAFFATFEMMPLYLRGPLNAALCDNVDDDHVDDGHVDDGHVDEGHVDEGHVDDGHVDDVDLQHSPLSDG